ncbi:hypothetical protein CFP56_010313 [Quercus suber]|uniref:Uncharacterized protein n=1 Tax=Quercus suber TaxID=58331 RepID=A0AAW0KZ48_QUESU
MGYNFFTLVSIASSSFETVNIPVEYKFRISLLMLVCKLVKACAHKYLSSTFKSNNFTAKLEKAEAKTLQINSVSTLTPYIARIKTFPLAEFLTLGLEYLAPQEQSNPMLSKVITQAGCGGVIRDVLSNSVEVELDAKFVIDIFSNMKNINGPPNSLLDDCREKSK